MATHEYNTQLLISVDTEVHVHEPAVDSPATQIYGDVGQGERYGVTHIMDELARRNWRCTFFLSVFDHLTWGIPAYREIAETISQRGFDLQLHTHVEKMRHNDRATRCIADFPYDQQCRILQDGVRLIQEWTSRSPTWHRAGNLGANRDTLRACRAVGLAGDSSFAFGWPQCHDLNISRDRRNALQRVEDLCELPVTTFQTMPGVPNFRYLDLTACTLGELCQIVDRAVRLRVPHVVFLMHSFSLVRREGTTCFVNQPEVDKFHRFLDHLGTIPGLSVATFDRLDCERELRMTRGRETSGGRLRCGLGKTYRRAWEHRNRGWKNRVFVLAPILGLATVIVAASLLVRQFWGG